MRLAHPVLCYSAGMRLGIVIALAIFATGLGGPFLVHAQTTPLQILSAGFIHGNTDYNSNAIRFGFPDYFLHVQLRDETGAPTLVADLSELGLSNSFPADYVNSNIAPNYEAGFFPVLPSGVSDGLKHFTITATDAAGNGAVATGTVMVDNTLPTGAISSAHFSTTSPRAGDTLFISGSLDGTGTQARIVAIRQTALQSDGVTPVIGTQAVLDYEIDPPVAQTAAVAALRNGTFTDVPLVLMERGGELADAAFIKFGFSIRDEAGNRLALSQTLSTQATSKPTAPSVLFLPGIQASRLYDSVGNKLWEPDIFDDITSLFLHPDGSSVNLGIYTEDVIDELPVIRTNIYKSFLSNLATWKTEEIISDYSVVPYDWRLSLDDILNYGNQIEGKIYYSGNSRATTTPYILQELRRLAGQGNVTIIAHSNGGLVAKALLKQLQDTNDPLLTHIENLVLVAVPQTGTPQAIGAALHGFDTGLPNDWFPLILSPQKARLFAQNAPMTYHLLPSASYFAGSGETVLTPPVVFTDGIKTQDFINIYGRTINSYSEFRSFLLGDDGRSEPTYSDLQSPSKLSSTLLSYAENQHAALDSWVPPASLQVYQIAGWGEDTLAYVNYYTGTSCTTASSMSTCSAYTPQLQYSPETVVDGDGTVATPSALAISTSTPNVTRWWIDLKKYNINHPITTAFGLSPITHSNLFELPTLRQLIKDLLRSKSVSSPEYVSSSTPMPISSKKLYFTLHSPLHLSVHDTSGNEVSAEKSEIPNAMYIRFGEVQQISIPSDSHPTLSLEGYATGSFTLDIKEKIGNQIIATTTFAGIPSATSTQASMIFTDGTIENASPLAIDGDGNGQVDITLAPKLNSIVMLPTADVVPPVTTASTTGPTGLNGWHIGNVDVSLTAVDVESGLATTTYSINNGPGNTYFSPFTVTQEGTTTIQFYSTDRAGNIEPAHTLTINIDKSAPEAKLTIDFPSKMLIITRLDTLTGTSTPVTVGSSLATTLTDLAGHTLAISYARNDQKTNYAHLRISTLSYDSAPVISAQTFLRYYWFPIQKASTTPLFIAQVKSTEGAIIALYNPTTNKTTIMSSTPQDDSADLAVLASTLMLKPRPLLKQYDGLVIPYVFTQKGRVGVGY